mgnify:CR=1 FL=1
MKKCLVYMFFLLTILVVSCTKNIDNTSDTSSINNTTLKSYFFVDELDDDDLKQPNKYINSIDDFIYLLDYLAFYQIDKKVSFYLSDDYKKEISAPRHAFKIAYNSSDLADVYAVVFDDSDYKDKGILSIKYSISKDIATVKSETDITIPFIHNYDYNFDENKNNNIKFKIDDIKNEISASNSEQLYYLAMNGYKPKPKKGSIAEEIYNKAKKILNSIIEDDMTEFQKIKAVYDYLTNEIYYDTETAYSLDTYLVKEQAYYLEGVFLNKCAVCDGKAKAYALLLNMLGIKCYRLTGVNELNYDHAWNIVNYDNKWYTSCTTYPEETYNFDEEKRIISSYNMLLQNDVTPYLQKWDYINYKHKELFNNIEEEPYDIFDMLSHDTINFKCENLDDVIKLIEEIKKLTSLDEYKIEFNYVGNDDNFQNELINYLRQQENVNLLNPLYNDNKIYSIIFFGEK